MTGVMSGTWGRGTGSTEGRGVRFARCGTTPVDPTGNWRAVCAERCKHGSREGPTEKGESTSLAAYSTAHSSQPGYESRICERTSGELGTGQTTDSLGEARRSFAPISGREPQTAPPDAQVRPGARRASRDLGTTAAGLVGASHGTGDQ